MPIPEFSCQLHGEDSFPRRCPLRSLGIFGSFIEIIACFIFLGGTKVTMIFLQRRRPMQLDSTGLAWSIAAVIFLDS